MAVNLRIHRCNLLFGVSSSGFKTWSLRFVCILYLVSWNLFFPPSLHAAEDSEKEAAQPSKLSLARSSQGPDTRAGLWKQRRFQKQKTATPEGPTIFGKSFLWIERRGLEQVQKMNYGGVFLRMGNLAQRSAFALGVRTWHSHKSSNWLNVQGSAAYSNRGYQDYNLQLGKVTQAYPEIAMEASDPFSLSPRELVRTSYRFSLYADLAYRDRPQEYFFGVGSGSSVSRFSTFRLQQLSYDAVSVFRPSRLLSAEVRLGLVQVDPGPSNDRFSSGVEQLFDDASAPGLSQQPDFFRLRADLRLDSRDRPGNPHAGGFVGFSFSRFDQWDSRQSEFNSFALDARHYLSLGSVQRVLAFRFFTSHDDAASGSSVPFYLQRALGGANTLRGFQDQRFRDNGLIYLSGEYRWEVAPALELAVFYDAGKVFKLQSDFGFSGMEKSIGWGIRLKNHKRVFVRFDFAKSREDTRTHVTIGPSF